jgi:hypothetical protein
MAGFCKHGDELSVSIKTTFLMRFEFLTAMKMSISLHKSTRLYYPETNIDRHFLGKATISFSREMYTLDSATL